MSSELNAKPHGGAGDTFRELGRELCPVCQHTDRCKASLDRDVILCFRETAETANGFRRIKQNGECATYVHSGSSADHGIASSSKGDWGRKAEKYTAALSEDRALALAQELHVTSEALKRVGAGWNQRKHTYTFPERDARGCVIGISTRRHWIRHDPGRRSCRELVRQIHGVSTLACARVLSGIRTHAV